MTIAAQSRTLTRADLHTLLYWMRLTRAFDERVRLLYNQGRIPGAAFSQRGHEAISVGASFTLAADDVVAPMHRDLGAYLLRGLTPRRIMAQMMGRATGVSRGRDVNTHGMGDLGLGIIGFISPLPDSMPLAVGAAMAFQYRGEARVAMTWFGDGSSSQGGAHESLNLAAVLRAPVVFICENNGYAYSTPISKQLAVENIADRALGYGMPGVVVDGNDVLAVVEVTQAAVDRARRGEGPTLIEAKTMRMLGHAFHDDASYVPPALIEEWTARDPLLRYERQLREAGMLDDDELAALDERIAAEVDDAVEFAENSPWPDGPATLDGVFAD